MTTTVKHILDTKGYDFFNVNPRYQTFPSCLPRFFDHCFPDSSGQQTGSFSLYAWIHYRHAPSRKLDIEINIFPLINNKITTQTIENHSLRSSSDSAGHVLDATPIHHYTVQGVAPAHL